MIFHFHIAFHRVLARKQTVPAPYADGAAAVLKKHVAAGKLVCCGAGSA